MAPGSSSTLVVTSTSLHYPIESFILFDSMPLFAQAELKLNLNINHFPFCSIYTISGSFNFVFTILFNFPSQYFFAIGLHFIFRFWRNLPPNLITIPNVIYSMKKRDLHATHHITGISPFIFQISIWIHMVSDATNSFPFKGAPKVTAYTELSFSFDLFDLRSPLLVESNFFSFPPVNNMLKFTG